MTPPDVNPELWSRYLKGTRAFDNLYGAGKRCPSNPDGARCTCLIPQKDYCRFFVGVVGLAEQIGGGTLEIVQGIK
jgi:hypothetical protein